MNKNITLGIYPQFQNLPKYQALVVAGCSVRVGHGNFSAEYGATDNPYQLTTAGMLLFGMILSLVSACHIVYNFMQGDTGMKFLTFTTTLSAVIGIIGAIVYGIFAGTYRDYGSWETRGRLLYAYWTYLVSTALLITASAMTAAVCREPKQHDYQQY